MRARLKLTLKLSFFFFCLTTGGVSLKIIQGAFPEEYQNVTKVIVFDEVDQWEAQKRYILADDKGRVSDDFAVSQEFYQRVSFWFDVYTRYNHYHKIIHHNLYPWVIYEVVDTSKMADPDRYMKLKMKWYQMMFENMQKKSGGYSDEERQLLGVLATATDPGRALATANKKIRYQSGQRDTTAKALKRAEPYLDHMEEIFVNQGLPEELTRLPLVESSFDLKAYSRVGAAGIWQFMPRTGKKFLKINRKIDERLSPLKSTRAAAELMKHNLKMLRNDWALTVTAYNHGPGGLRRAVREVASTDIEVIVEKYSSDRFSFASANFYACFLAVLYAEKYRDYVFPRIKRGTAPAVAKLETMEAIRARELVSTYKVSQEDFLVYNPDFRRALNRDLIIPKKVRYFVPLTSKDASIASND